MWWKRKPLLLKRIIRFLFVMELKKRNVKEVEDDDECEGKEKEKLSDTFIIIIINKY